MAWNSAPVSSVMLRTVLYVAFAAVVAGAVSESGLVPSLSPAWKSALVAAALVSVLRMALLSVFPPSQDEELNE